MICMISIYPDAAKVKHFTTLSDARECEVFSRTATSIPSNRKQDTGTAAVGY